MKDKVKFLSVMVALVSSLSALEHEPWLYPPFEFHTGMSLDVNFYSNVNNGFNPLGYHSTNYDVKGNLVAPLSPKWDVELEIELERTTKFGFGFESVALQGRYQFFDDVQGDFVSLAAIANIRVVPKQRLRDVSTPYHNMGNFELGLTLGKEFTREFEWYLRTYLFGAIGQANLGYPWISFLYELEWKAVDCFVLRPLVSGYFGLGNHTLINVRHFNSYALFNHQSVDVGLRVDYLFKRWGTLSLQYLYRPYAKSFPENFNSIKLSYDLPFSF